MAQMAVRKIDWLNTQAAGSELQYDHGAPAYGEEGVSIYG